MDKVFLFLDYPDNYADMLSRGERVPFAPGACGQCWHLSLWHDRKHRNDPRRCQKCGCPDYQDTGRKGRDSRLRAPVGWDRKPALLKLIVRGMAEYGGSDNTCYPR